MPSPVGVALPPLSEPVVAARQQSQWGKLDYWVSVSGPLLLEVTVPTAGL